MTEEPSERPQILERSEHNVSRRNIDSNAVKVLYRLHNAGFKGYLVGGGVRDLLLGLRPKDFDVVTDARPREIRRLFRNSRIIGRRFRLAHVFFKSGIIEVATFRRDPDPEEQATGPDELLITSDNTFGTPREDAFRRDFTVNALFYSIADYSIIDYVGGLDDLTRRLIHTIGDPDVRFQEDPVRMLRACELAGRLGFGIEDGTQEAIERHRKELEKASPARLTEEVVELLRCGRSAEAARWMLDLGLLEVLLPEAYELVSADEDGVGDFSQVLPALDRLAQEGRELSDGTLLGALLLPAALRRRYDIEAVDGRPMPRRAIDELVEETTETFVARFALSGVRVRGMRRALTGFQRMAEPGWKEASRTRFAGRPEFSDALGLFEVMVTATDQGREELEAWREAERNAPPPGSSRGRGDGGGGGGSRRRRRRRRRGRRK